jgi:hypothetical protein
VLTKELLTELAVDPYLRAAYRKHRSSTPHAGPDLAPDSFDACVGCCDPGSDPMPDVTSVMADDRVGSVGSSA